MRGKSFGELIRWMRLRRNISLRELSRRLKMDSGNLSKLELSEKAPPKKAKKIIEICKAAESEDMIEILKTLAYQHHISVLREEFFGDN